MLTSKISCWKILSTVILLFIHSVLLHAQGKGVVIKDTIAISPRSNDPSSVSQTITKTVSAYPFFSFMAGTNDGNFGEPMVLGLWWCSDIPYNVRAEWNIYVESSNSDVSFYLELAGYKRLDHVGQVSSAVMSGAAEVGNRDTYNFYVGWRGYPSRVTVNDAGDTAIIHFERNYETEKILGTIILTATPGFALLPLHHFKLQMVPDSIGHGDTAQVFITAQNADSVEIFDLYCFNWLSINAGENQFGHFEFITSPNAAISAGNSPLKGRNSQTLTRRLGKAAAAMETPPYEFDYYYLPFLGHLYYIADSELPKSDTAFAVTVASVYDTTIKGIDSVVIKAGFDHFEVTFDKDTAAFTESAKIFVQAKDANDIDVELEADKLLTLSVITNDEYGTFIDKNNDTLKTTPVKPEHIPYGDARTGLIQFSAVKKNPADPLLCKVHVELEDDPAKEGEGEIPVAEQTMKIVMEGEREVVPRNLLGQQTPPAPINANKKEFKVQLTRNKAAVIGHSFKLTNDYIDGTGGHDHRAPRRERNRDNYGWLILQRTGGDFNSPYDGQTQKDGIEKFDFVSSFFGDRMCLRVETAQPNKKQFLWDTLSFAEKVQGLSPLPSGSDNLITYTSTETYHALVNSDYATVRVRSAVSNAVRAYAEEFGFENDIFLAAIDMSLPQGGKFDINGSWMGAHQLHREGKSIDFSRTYRDSAGGVIQVEFYRDDELIETRSTVNEERLDFWFDRRGFNRLERNIGLIHYESRN